MLLRVQEPNKSRQQRLGDGRMASSALLCRNKILSKCVYIKLGICITQATVNISCFFSNLKMLSGVSFMYCMILTAAANIKRRT